MNPGSFFLFLFIALILALSIGAGLRLRERLRMLQDILERVEKMLNVSDKDASLIFSQSAGLRQPWKRYVSTFIPTPDGQPKTERLANDYFKTNEILDHHINLRLYLALPNILVGIGVLGTFIGLVTGIGGFDTESVDGVRQSIAVLLSGMSTAFYTSIFGMLCSILFNFYEKTQIKEISTKLQKVVVHLDEKYLLSFNDRKRIEKAESIRSVKIQSRIVGQVMSDLFALKSKEGAVVKPSYILGALRTEAKDQTAALKTFAEVLAKVMGGAQASVSELAQQQTVNQQGMQDMVLAAKEVLKTGVELTKRMRMTGEQMDERITSLNTSFESMGGTTQAMKESGKALEFVSMALQDEFSTLRSSQQQHVQILIESLKKTQELSEGYAAQFTAIETSLKDIFSKIEEGLANHRKETGESMDAYVGSLTSQMKDASTSLKNAVSLLSKEIKDAGERRDKKRTPPVVRR
ncbi:MAG: hypothetical protein KTR29_19695 [Rhodothermaceae bacterium]|nr:hypothetical protein [Rhodothermaceae bacterium]